MCTFEDFGALRPTRGQDLTVFCISFPVPVVVEIGWIRVKSARETRTTAYSESPLTLGIAMLCSDFVLPRDVGFVCSILLSGTRLD